MVVFAMAIGPGESEMALDSLQSIVDNYPLAYIVVRDDATVDGTWEKVNEWAQGKQVTLTRNLKPNGIKGLPRTIFDTFASIAAFPNVEMVIKLDPDACLVVEGLVEAVRHKFERHGPGMCGSYDVSPSGTKRDFRVHLRKFIADISPIGPIKGSNKWRFGPVFYLRFLFKALRNGYTLGEHCLGGLYALHGDTLSALWRNGFWSSVPLSASSCIREEDVLVGLGTKSVGHALISLNDYPGNVVTWLQHQPPLPFSSSEICQRRFVAIHPLKGDQSKTRGELAEFRRLELTNRIKIRN